MKKYDIITVENQSFPLVNWIKFSFSKKHIILLSSEDYKKMSFRNRYVLAGSSGLISLSIPLVNGRNQKTFFKEVKIFNDGKWQLTHWRTITSCYNKSPFFEFYEEALQKFFNSSWKFLFDWNLSVLEWLREILKYQGKIEVLDYNPQDAEDMRDRWLPRNFQDDPTIVRYPQIFEDRIGFQNNLSILDLLFNVGPNAADLLALSS